MAAYRAGWRLSDAPAGAAAFFAERARPLPVEQRERIARLVAELDDDDFGVREKATAALEKLGPQAEPSLRETLSGSPTPEVRRRTEALLKKLGTPEALDARRRWLRALEALERIGTTEARQVVEALAKGTTEAPSVTVEARATLGRMGKR
jgi:HEAT repeat protein